MTLVIEYLSKLFKYKQPKGSPSGPQPDNADPIKEKGILFSIDDTFSEAEKEFYFSHWVDIELKIILSEDLIFKDEFGDDENDIDENSARAKEIDPSERDERFVEAARIIVASQQGSTALLQRKFNLGSNRAGRIIDQLEAAGIVGPFEGSKAREVKVKDEQTLSQILEIDLSKVPVFDTQRCEIFREKYSKEIIARALIEVERAKAERAEYKRKLEIRKEENERMEIERIKEDMLVKERKKRLHKLAKTELTHSGQIGNTSITPIRDIPSQEVQDRVWTRDKGHCVKCGSQEKLEFDHIIPVSVGGANTYRNIQLLCEKCNREKSNNIGVK